jgi:hypothetical protein
MAVREGFGLAGRAGGFKDLAMPQAQLPLFPVGMTAITAEIGFERRGDQVVYVNGHLPVFTHRVDDLASFRLFTSQLIDTGTASQGDIARAFGVPLIAVKRAHSQFRKRGSAAFFQSAKRRKGHRLTPERLEEVQAMLDEELSVPEISRRTGLLASTLHKAIDQGRLRQKKRR